MLSFKPISIADKDAITACTYPSRFLNCDFAFANMCSWRFLYDSEFAVVDGFLLIRFLIEEKGRKHQVYMFPVGNGDFRHIIAVLEDDARANGHPLWILGVTPDEKKTLNQLFPSEFIYIVERDYFDYIYLRSDLQQLKGKKYQAKRNHINKFRDNYRYTSLPLTPDLAPKCMELECKWYRDNHTEEDAEDLEHEHRSIAFALNHFRELDLLGCALCVEGEIIAFTYGSPINRYTFGVHVEKADIRYEGVFSVINREFVSCLPEQFLYINREEDLGISGLRRSKLSYHPVILLEKNTAVKRR
ncbi:MAG: phosphatidylglycerol lysyltransferase domain-containing protein [Tannerella sp.]|nr:phosphatidylglycerol lysyltransferase domain-containing protein [Tannerella sp.]